MRIYLSKTVFKRAAVALTGLEGVIYMWCFWMLKLF